MTEQSKLNEYSQKVFEYLKENNPGLIKLISFFPDSNFGDHYLEIKYVSPYNNPDYDLWLSTEDTRLTVGFYKFHCHFDTYLNADFFGEMREALEIFTKIILEEFIVVLFLQKDRFMGSRLTTINNLNVVDINSSQLLKGKYDKVALVSWFGTYNKEQSL